MAIKTEEIKRVFKHGGITLEDPSPSMTKEEVLDFYSNQYPELTNSNVSGGEIINDELVFEFNTSIGTKG